MFTTIRNIFNNSTDTVTNKVKPEFKQPIIINTPKVKVFNSYAEEVNSKFYNTKSHFVTLNTRASTYITTKMKKALELKIKEFRRRHPTCNEFGDLKLCHSLETTLDNIIIDETMQRQLINKHIDEIISQFTESKVMAIQVYEDPEQPGKYIAWDGQHTAIALYVIATEAFLQDTSECIIPITVYPMSKKHEIRQNFIGLNGDDKQPLDLIDIFHQQVYTIRADKVTTDPKCVDAEIKQQFLEKYNLFVTDKKFGDESKPGAISRLPEIVKYKPVIIEAFGKYFTQLGKNRAVNSTELPAMMLFFNECVNNKIDLTDEYVNEVADIMQSAFGANFSSGGPFWAQAESCYLKWHKKAFAGTDLKPKFGKTEPNGVILIIALLKKKLKDPRNVPNFLKKNYNYTVNAMDIWE